MPSLELQYNIKTTVHFLLRRSLFLLKPMSIVATIILGLLELAPNYFCYHRLVFAGTNIQLLLPSSLDFAGAGVLFCYNRPSDLPEPVSVNQMFFLFATDEGEHAGVERRRRATGAAALPPA